MEQSATNPTTQPKQKWILIIEDEFFIGELYVRALKKAGYSVDLSIDGQEGLDKALSDKYDIILLDIMVPTITGTEILRQLRATKQAVKAKIIVTTNLEQSEETKQEIERQADAYIIKAEITPKQLVGFLDGIG